MRAGLLNSLALATFTFSSDNLSRLRGARKRRHRKDISVFVAKPALLSKAVDPVGDALGGWLHGQGPTDRHIGSVTCLCLGWPEAMIDRARVRAL